MIKEDFALLCCFLYFHSSLFMNILMIDDSKKWNHWFYLEVQSSRVDRCSSISKLNKNIHPLMIRMVSYTNTINVKGAVSY